MSRRRRKGQGGKGAKGQRRKVLLRNYVIPGERADSAIAALAATAGSESRDLAAVVAVFSRQNERPRRDSSPPTTSGDSE